MIAKIDTKQLAERLGIDEDLIKAAVNPMPKKTIKFFILNGDLDGLSDSEAAIKTGKTRAAIHAARKRLGVPERCNIDWLKEFNRLGWRKPTRAERTEMCNRLGCERRAISVAVHRYRDRLKP